MVKFCDELHEQLCNDKTIPPRIWLALALQLLLRIRRIDETTFNEELSKLSLPTRMRHNLLNSRHCMVSPLSDTASLIAVTTILQNWDPVHSTSLQEPLYWAMASQIAVHSKSVLQDMAKKRSEAPKFSRKQLSEQFRVSMGERGLRTSMNVRLAQPVLHFLSLFDSTAGTHHDKVYQFLRRCNFKYYAQQLEEAATHKERMSILMEGLRLPGLRAVQILRILESTVRPEWAAAWSSSYRGKGAEKVLSNLDNHRFHKLVMRGVKSIAPCWVLKELDELPLRLTSEQTSQHVRCEVRKLAGRHMDSFALPSEDPYPDLFYPAMDMLRAHAENSNVFLPDHFGKFRDGVGRHKRKYKELVEKSREENLIARYKIAIAKGSEVEQNCFHIASWLAVVRNARRARHEELTQLLQEGLSKVRKVHKNSRLHYALELQVERALGCECESCGELNSAAVEKLRAS